VPRGFASQRVEPNACVDNASRNACTSPSVKRMVVAHSEPINSKKFRVPQN